MRQPPVESAVLPGKAGSSSPILRQLDQAGGGAEPLRAIPGPPHSALIQSVICLLTWPKLLQGGEAELGDIFQIRLLMPRESSDRGVWPLVRGTAVLVSSPELLRELFSRSGPELAGGEARRFMEWFVGSDSLLILDGEQHREERRALLSLFTSQRLAEVEAVTESVTGEVMARLGPSGTMGLTDFLQDLVGEISIRLMFGPVEAERSRRLWACVHEGFLTQAWSSPFMLLPGLRKNLGRWMPGRRAFRAIAEFRAMLAEEARLTADGKRPGGSWLSQLLALEPAGSDPDPDSDLRLARVLTILEGMETVAAALRWTFYHLFRNPVALDRACQEARSENSSYTEAVCKEAARLHPPIPILARRVTSDTTLGGYPLERSSFLIGAIYLTHRRPDLYPDPHRFRPERFLERSYTPYEYLPFGGGIRRCLGHGFGLQQAAQVAHAILRNFDLEGKPRTRRVSRRAVIMVPADPLRTSWQKVT